MCIPCVHLVAVIHEPIFQSGVSRKLRGGDPTRYWIPRLAWNDFLEARTSLKLERQLNSEVIKTHLTGREHWED